MSFKPMFALHKNKAGRVLTASSFNFGHNVGPWLRDLDIRAGDRVEFHEAAGRDESDEIELPPSLASAEAQDELGISAIATATGTANAPAF